MRRRPGHARPATIEGCVQVVRNFFAMRVLAYIGMDLERVAELLCEVVGL